jgi:eukaryotic-like serine/threonine-protein kinase
MIGKIVSHYRILEKLGGGGMGVVYKAEDNRLGRVVALKFLPAQFAHDEQLLKRFNMEARAASALNHINICTIHAIDEFEGQPFLVMELLEGHDLRSFIAGKPVSVATIIDLAMQITDALDATHARDIIHRDIKPANLFVTTRGVAKILDFGLAKMVTRCVEESATTNGSAWQKPGEAMLTSPGTVVGTVAYMSPEQVRDEELDGRSDLFSFGAVLYEMATGQRAFAGKTLGVTLSAILHGQPIPLTQADPQLPLELVRVISKTLEKDRAARYQSASELRADFDRLKRGLSAGETDLSTGNLRHATPRTAMAAVRKRRSKARIASLAVLPFVNESADPEMEYFSDGITESILDALTNLSKVRIMARSTVFRYKGKTADPRDVGRRLRVQAVLTGRVSLRGETLVVRVELLDVALGSRLWGEHYNLKISEIFAVQEEISREISEKLRLKLTREQKRRLTHRHTEDLAAYHHYLKGRYYWNKRTEQGLRKGIEYFGKAIESDPEYAAAYAGLADCFPPLGAYRILSPEQAFTRCKEAATKALKLDDHLAEAHTALALAKLFYDWDWTKAEAEFRRAIELNANYPIAHQWYAVYLMAMERPEESLASIQHALYLDPLSLAINTHMGWGFYFTRRYQEGIEQLRKTIELDADFSLAHFVLGQIYTQAGMYSEAIRELQTAATLSSRLPAVLSALGYCQALAGEAEQAKKVLLDLKEISTTRYVSPFDVALINVGLGQRNEAFESLAKAVQDRSSWLIWLSVEPALDGLRSDQRFTKLLRQVGLDSGSFRDFSRRLGA